MRRRARDGTAINLDSLTDIVANSVGIMLFLMVFAVVSARGSFVRKRLPMVESTAKEQVSFLCSGETIRSYHPQKLVDQFLAETPRHLTYDNILQFRDQVNQRRLTDECFVLTGKCDAWRRRTNIPGGYRLEWKIEYLAIEVRPRPDALGEPVGLLTSSGSRYRTRLAQLDKDREWVNFLVDVDGLDVFRESRRVARELGLQTGWMPTRMRWPQRLVIFPRPKAGEDRRLPGWIGPSDVAGL